MTQPKLTVIAVDFAKYTVKVIAGTLKAGGVVICIVKSSGGIGIDPRFKQHIQDLLSAYEYVAIYHWVDPIHYPEKQIDFLADLVSWIYEVGGKVAFVMLDIEQWWNNWGTWYDAIMKRIAWSTVQIINPALLSKHAKQCMAYASNTIRAEVIGYTSYGFVTSYAPEMAEWMDQYKWIIANYIIKSESKINLSDFVQLKEYLPLDKSPLLPPGITMENVVGWQFTGDLISLPGMFGNEECTKVAYADVNLLDGEWLAKLMSGTQVDPVNPEETQPEEVEPVQTEPENGIYYKVASWVYLGLRMRSEPNDKSEILVVQPRGTILEFAGEISGVWYKVSCDGTTGWVHSGFISDGYVTSNRHATYKVPSWVTRGLRLRSEPNDGAQILAVYLQGTLVEYLGVYSGNWYKVSVNGKTGWMHSGFLVKI